MEEVVTEKGKRVKRDYGPKALPKHFQKAFFLAASQFWLTKMFFYWTLE